MCWIDFIVGNTGVKTIIVAGSRLAFLSLVPFVSQSLPSDAQETPMVTAEERKAGSRKDARGATGGAATTVLDQIVISRRYAATGDMDGYAPKAATIGGKEAAALREIPNSVTVITRQRMDDQNLITVDDALKQVPGVSVVPWNNSTSQFWMRGYLADVMYDGVPAYNNSSSDSQQFDLSMYDRVEVLKGPAGLMKGVGNPGGTVNLVRKRGLEKSSLEINGSAGSWDNYLGAFDAGGPLNADGSLRGRFVFSKQNRHYWHHSTKTDRNLVYGALDFDLTDRTTLSLSAAYQNSLADSPSMGLPAYTDGRFLDVARSTHVYPSWNQFKYDTYDLSGELRHEFANDWVFSAKVNHRIQKRFWKDSFPTTGVDPDTMTATYARRAADWDISHTGVDAYFSGPMEAWGQEHILTFGYNYEINGSTGKTGSLPAIAKVPILDPNSAIPEPDFLYTNGYDDRDRQGGLYGQARIRLADPLLLVAGARLSSFDADSRTIAPSPVTGWKQGAKAKNEFTPYVGLIYDLTSEISAYASYSDIFIPQTARMADGTVLDPRIGGQVEAGLKGSFLNGNLDATLAVFQTRDQNRSMPDPDNPGFYIQAGETEVKGFEVEVSGSPLKNLQLSAGYTWMDSSYVHHQSLAGEVFSLFEPKHSFKSYARYTFDDPSWSKWTIAGGLTYSSGMIGTGAETRRQDDYILLNAQVDYRLSENATASLQVSNILDEKYYARVGGLNSYNTYGEPRSAMLSVRSKF